MASGVRFSPAAQLNVVKLGREHANFLACEEESNAGALCNQQIASRGGGQPEERDHATRGEGDSSFSRGT